MSKMSIIGPRGLARLGADRPPVLIVVIDTEEEFDWNKPFSRDSTGVDSIQYQPLAHEIFDKYGIRPTYVIDYPVAATESSVAVLKPLADQGLCDIGTHLHPWVTPPHEEQVNQVNSYPGNLPAELERRKLETMTETIAANFGRRPVMYKAGRYGVGPMTAKLLEDLGYEIDLSVVPHTTFGGDGGPDFRDLPSEPFWFGADRQMLEIPLSRGFAGLATPFGPQFWTILDSPFGRKLHLAGIAARLRLLERITLTPEGVDHAAHRRLVRSLMAQGHRVYSFTYHSSSLGIANTPYVRSVEQRREFLRRMDQFFRLFTSELGGIFSTPLDLKEQLLSVRV